MPAEEDVDVLCATASAIKARNARGIMSVRGFFVSITSADNGTTGKNLVQFPNGHSQKGLENQI